MPSNPTQDYRPSHDPAMVEKAAALWRDDCPVKEIADRLSSRARKLTPRAVIGIARRRRSMFPARANPVRP